MGLLLNGGGTLLTEEEELLSTFFASVFIDKISPQQSLTLRPVLRECWEAAFPLVKEDWVREQLD